MSRCEAHTASGGICGMSRCGKCMTLGWLVVLWVVWLWGVAVTARAMPAQVMIIRHAEKFEDIKKIHLNPRGRTRAKALAQFFQSDPRVLE